MDGVEGLFSYITPFQISGRFVDVIHGHYLFDII